MNNWVNCKDSLPEDGQRVLCYEDYRLIGKKWHGCEVFFYRDGIGFVNLADDDDCYGSITHWMPLPKGPNDES